MPKYLVKHTAKVEYLVEVDADDEEEATNADSYFDAVESNPSDHYWYDSEIVEILNEDE